MAGRFPRLAQCVWSTRRGQDWILNTPCLASELTLHKKPSDLIPRFRRKLLILSVWVLLLEERVLHGLHITAGCSFHSFLSPEDKGNGSIHNALKWKSGLISLSKGSNLPTENIIQLSAEQGERLFWTSLVWLVSFGVFFLVVVNDSKRN